MKNLFLFIAFCFSLFASSQEPVKVKVIEPGTLSSLLTEAQKDTCQYIVVSGKLNSADIKVLRKMAGADGHGKLRKGKFTVKTELSERMRRGYLTKSMNTDRLIWNASASWQCLKGKGKLKLEVNDILNNADNFSSKETSNQQVSTWSDHMHHFAALSFTYHLDPKQNK